jgi:hypothetical protein
VSDGKQNEGGERERSEGMECGGRRQVCEGNASASRMGTSRVNVGSTEGNPRAHEKERDRQKDEKNAEEKTSNLAEADGLRRIQNRLVLVQRGLLLELLLTDSLRREGEVKREAKKKRTRVRPALGRQ